MSSVDASKARGDPARPPPKPASSTRAYIGLGVLGWGLAILLGVAPHEDPIVAGGLVGLGIALLITAPRLPHVERVPALWIGAAGLVGALGVLGYDLLFAAPLNVTKVAIIAFGLGVAGLAPFARAAIPVGPRGRRLQVGTLVACAVPVLGVPLAVWTLQATFKSLVGTTPLEVFIHFGLLLPLAAFLTLLGWQPRVEGQDIFYMTPRGEMGVEVGAACSGIQAMALFGAVLALFLLVERPVGRRLALWSAVGLLGVYVANLLRLFTIVVVGHAWGVQALLRTHQQAGWIFFVAWAVLFAWLARRPAAAIDATRARPLASAPPGSASGIDSE